MAVSVLNMFVNIMNALDRGIGHAIIGSDLCIVCYETRCPPRVSTPPEKTLIINNSRSRNIGNPEDRTLASLSRTRRTVIDLEVRDPWSAIGRWSAWEEAGNSAPDSDTGTALGGTPAAWSGAGASVGTVGAFAIVVVVDGAAGAGTGGFVVVVAAGGATVVVVVVAGATVVVVVVVASGGAPFLMKITVTQSTSPSLATPTPT